MATPLWSRFIRWGFARLYNEFAWSYDAVSWLVSRGAWRDWQRAALPYISGRRLLELGHGPGHLLADLQRAGYEVHGLDVSPAMGRLARRRAPGVPLVRGRGQALPFASHHFDTVLATFPTEYVAELASLREIWRVLRPDGRFLIVPEAHFTGHGPVQRLLEWLYAITGQRGFSQDGQDRWAAFQERLEMVGFAVTRHPFTLPGSQVTVIVCRVVG